MSPANSSSIARVLASAWQQRRNTDGTWGLVVVAALCSAAPIGLFVWSLLCPPALVQPLRDKVALSGWIGAAAILVVGWAMLVGNVLQQNHPTLARLVPGHVAQLRVALLAAWAVLSLVVAAVPGFETGAPLAWACASAAALALVAAALRWPLLWWLPALAPFAMGEFQDWSGRDAVIAALLLAWQREGELVSAIVTTACAVVLVLAVQPGGSRHAASFEARRQLMRFSLRRANAPGDAAGWGWLGRLVGFNARLYAWWLRRLLARGDSRTTARLMLGLGPMAHWTTRIASVVLTLVVTALAIVVPLALLDVERWPMVVAWSPVSILLGIGTLSFQTHAALSQSRREQALLALLPGVPEAAALDRWLAWQMSLQCALSIGVAIVLARCLADLAESMSPGVTHSMMGSAIEIFSAALSAMLPWQWRRWARLRTPTTFETVSPLLAVLALSALALALHLATGAGYLSIGVAFAIVSMLWCAWRWRRMADEPSAFPVGRAAG